MKDTAGLLTPDVIERLSREIYQAGGTEIFAVLSRDKADGAYSKVTVVCRGTEAQVPALISRTKPGNMTVHNHPSGILQPSNADLNVATLFGEEGVGSMIVNNEVTRCRVIVEPSEEEQPVAVDEDDVLGIFETGGPLSKTLPNYEPREGQAQMAAAVTAILNENRILAVEAGTGTGKSLAYVIPALLWTKRNKGRVVIATKTIALQEQLVFKDIPFARKVVPDAPLASLVKGRNNYVCLRKLHDMQTNQLTLFGEEETLLKKEIEDLGDWVEKSGSGDRADLPFTPSRDAWDMVRSDADMCLGAKCPFFQKAPFYESRRAAARSKVLVVNQALLFSDLALRMAAGNYTTSAVIPPYEHVILDEAHSMEDIATDHFGEKVSSLGVRFTMGRFLSAARGNRGILQRLFQGALAGSAVSLLKVLEERLIPEFQDLQTQATDRLYALSRALHEALNPDAQKQVVIWLKQDLLDSPRLGTAKEAARELMSRLHQLVLVIRNIRTAAKDQPEAFLEKMEGLFIEMDARLNRLETTLAALKQFAISQDKNKVPWLELRIGRQHEEFEYRVSPLDVSPMLREALFKPFKSVIMTSATLDLNDGFGFFSTRSGLRDFEDKAWDSLLFESPFDFHKQARLFLARLPSAPNQRGFVEDLVDLILKTALSDHIGGTLVLFTSYQLLYATARHLETPLARAGIDLLVQGRSSRSYLVSRMKKTQGVLLGTDSFWEGVDLPGEALTKLIITKLPFRQVGDPIFEARCTAIEEGGDSSFKQLSLPLALLKFKQGAGRLIRHRNDRGVLIVADNRIRGKGYGRQFLKLVDRYPVWDVTPDQILDLLRRTPQAS